MLLDLDSAEHSPRSPVPSSIPLLSLSSADSEMVASTDSVASDGSPRSPPAPLTLQDKIDDTLVQTCTDLVLIKSVIREADQR